MRSLQHLNPLSTFLFFILTCYFVIFCRNTHAANNKAGTVVDSGISGDFNVGISYFGYSAQKTSKEERFDFTSHGNLKTDGKAANKFIARIEGILKNLRITKYVHTKDSCIDEPAGVYQYDCSGFIGIFVINEILPEYCTALNKGRCCIRKYNCGNNINNTTIRPLASDLYHYFETMEVNDKFFGPVDHFKDVQKGDIIAIKYADKWRKRQKNIVAYIKTENQVQDTFLLHGHHLKNLT